MTAVKSISETLDVYNIRMVTETSNDQIPHNSTHPEELLYLNGTFQVIESTLSHVGILHIGGVEGVGLAVILGTIASLALVIRGTFIYYLKNYAPKGRAINRLMLFDQVSDQIRLQIKKFITTGCPRPEFTERNGYSSELKHF